MKNNSYSKKLKSPLWQKKRLEIMKRDNFQCQLCLDTETTLNVHHKQYINGNDPWEYDNDFLITLCEDCHREIGCLKENIPFDQIKIHKSNVWDRGGKIMFLSYPGICSMRIYDEKDFFIVGFNLRNDLPYLIKLFKYSNHGKR